MSKEESSRHHREVRTTRMIIMGAGALALLIVVILGFGYWREYVARASDPVATVAGKAISIEDYARRLDFRRKATEQQLQYMQAQYQAVAGNESLAGLFQQQLQQLQFTMMLLPEQTLDQMVAEQLVRQEAERRGIKVTPEEIDNQINESFADPAQPADAPAPSGAPDAAATPAPVTGASPTATPAPTADVQSRLTEFLTLYDIKRSEYRSMVETQILYTKLEKDMGASVPTTAEQVHARHILLEDEEKAREVLAKVKSGGNFEELAKAESQDEGSKESGGDLGWFPKGVMATEFENVAFQLEPKQTSELVQTNFGWHIIQVLEKEQSRTLDPGLLEERQQQVIGEWLETGVRGPDVTTNLTEDNKNWVYQKIKWRPAV